MVKTRDQYRYTISSLIKHSIYSGPDLLDANHFIKEDIISNFLLDGGGLKWRVFYNDHKDFFREQGFRKNPGYLPKKHIDIFVLLVYQKFIFIFSELFKIAAKNKRSGHEKYC